MSYYTNGNTASEMIARADANYEWQERREWEKAHLPPPGDGVEKDNATAQGRAVASTLQPLVGHGGSHEKS